MRAAFDSGRNAIQYMPEWGTLCRDGHAAGRALHDFAPPAHWTRKQSRSTGRVSQLSVRSAEMALADAGLLDDPALADGRMGAWPAAPSPVGGDGGNPGIRQNMPLNGVTDDLSANS